jgi:serine protease Do
MVVGVDAQGAATRAGIRAGDVILAVNGNWPRMYADIQEAVATTRPGTVLALTVWRHRAALRVGVTATEVPWEAPSPREQDSTAQRDDARLGLGLIERKAAQETGLPYGSLYVRTVAGAARRAGIQVGDQILGVNDASTSTAGEFDDALAAAQANDVVAMLVARGSLRSFVVVNRR